MNWSTDGQTIAFLALTRMVSLNESVMRAIVPELCIEPGMRILDVGCGSGEYCFRLGACTDGVEYTGVDFDQAFIDFANRRASVKASFPFEAPNKSNRYQFMQADGTSLPFDADAFDAVVSHTYLTAVPKWNLALAEMIRVCKPGGIVSSITSLTDDFYGAGSMELAPQADNADDGALVEKVNDLKGSLLYRMATTDGIKPYDVPRAFSEMGLVNVRCTPLAYYFCLSDSRTTDAEARRHIELLRLVELEEIDQLARIPATRTQLSECELSRYREIVDERYTALMSMIGSDCEWNWFGNSSLLVCGTKAS